MTAALDPRIERSRAAILAGAAEALYEQGWSAVTPENVAARAGVSRATVYRHWPDRTTLVVDTIEAVVEQIAADAYLPASGDLRADLLRELQRFARITTSPNERRLVAALAHNACDDADIAKLRDRLVARHTALMREVVAQAATDGVLAATTDPDVAVAELLGPVTYRLLLSGEEAPAEFVAQVVDRFIRSSAPERTTRPARRPTTRARSRSKA